MDQYTRFRRRMEAKGYKQIAAWLDADTVAALQQLQADMQVDRNVVISAALKQAAARLKLIQEIENKIDTSAPPARR